MLTRGPTAFFIHLINEARSCIDFTKLGPGISFSPAAHVRFKATDQKKLSGIGFEVGIEH